MKELGNLIKPNSLGKMVMKHREKMHIGRNVACENVILTKGYAHKGEYARSVNLLILCCCSENYVLQQQHIR